LDRKGWGVASLWREAVQSSNGTLFPMALLVLFFGLVMHAVVGAMLFVTAAIMESLLARGGRVMVLGLSFMLVVALGVVVAATVGLMGMLRVSVDIHQGFDPRALQLFSQFRQARLALWL